MRRTRGLAFAYVVFPALISASLSNVSLAQEDEDAAALQREFSSAKDLQLVHALSEIPSEERKFFQDTIGQEIAEFGEFWSPSDNERPGVPTAQFLFAGMSKHLLAVLYLRGGFGGQTLWLFLTHPGSDTACSYDLGKPPATLSMASVLFAFSEDAKVTPMCRIRNKSVP